MGQFEEKKFKRAEPTLHSGEQKASIHSIEPFLKEPRVAVLTGVDLEKLRHSGLSSALAALKFCAGSSMLAAHLGEPKETFAPPEEILAVAQHTIGEVARTRKPYLFVPPSAEVVSRAIDQVFSSLGMREMYEVLKNPGILKSSNERCAVLDISPSLRMPSPFGTKRHIGTKPIVGLQYVPTLVTDLLTNLDAFLALQKLGQGTLAQDARGNISLLQCARSLDISPDVLVVDATIFDKLSQLQRSAKPVAQQASGDSTGFMRDYSAQDFRDLLAFPGSKLGLLTHRNHILGYVVSFLDSASLPHQANRIKEAMHTVGVPPEEPCGYAKILHVTEMGRRYETLTGVSIYNLIHDSVIDAAKAAGLKSLVAEVRAYPYPNTAALAVHRAHGWRDVHASLLYPYAETSRGIQYTLGKIIVRHVAEN